jgi:predicted outer membrane repeat protein
MMNDSHVPTVKNCTFVENFAEDRGAGIYNLWAAPQVIGCTFNKNMTNYWGGGIYNLDSWPTIVNSSFTENQASWGGGAVYAVGSFSDFLMMNCTMVGNLSEDGAGMHLSYNCYPTLINCTFANNIAQNQGGALNLVQSWPKLVNCILWGDTPDEIAMNSTSDPNVSYSCVQGGWSGTGNIDSDPLFVEGAINDTHLLYPSPCRDTGDNDSVTELTDFEGDPRIAYGTVDMGADEFYTHLYHTGNTEPGGEIQCKIVGLPAAWPVGLFLSTGLLDPPLAHKWGLFYLQSPFFTFPLFPIPGNGILVLPGTLPLTPPAPYDIYMQALVGSELTNPNILEVRRD